jgi:hypothetical protein
VTRGISTRIEKLEALRPQHLRVNSLRVSFWNGATPPEPYMTIHMVPGRRTRTVYHQGPGLDAEKR